MEIVTLIIAVAALVVAVLAYARTGGIQDLRDQVNALGPTKEALRTKTTDTLDVLRTKTADTLGRLEKVVRGDKEEPPSAAPAESKEETAAGPVDRTGPERGG
jgi:hypothetical protein